MSKIFCLVAFMLSMFLSIRAQSFSRGIGLRVGFDAQEVSYQKAVGKHNRIEYTAGVNTFGYNTVAQKLCRGAGFNVLYQRLRDWSSIADGFKWYWGLGGAVLTHADLFGAGVLGQVGLEYNLRSFWRFSLDYRPAFYWLPGTVEVFRVSWNVPCLGLRYCF